jgi:hypothetical protein
MRKIFWIGILGIVTMIGNASAQVPSECGDGVIGYGGPCRFACQAGDFIWVSGSAAGGYWNEIIVSASCGYVSLSCHGGDSCQARSERAVAYDDDNGTCTASAFYNCGSSPDGYWCPAYGDYRCASVTPEEAAALEDSGQGFVVQIPKQ